MALPSGKHCYYRPNRTKAKRFSARDCGRVVGYARKAGEDCSEIKRAVREALIEAGCEELTCDCEKLYVLISLAIAVGLTAVAVVAKNGILLNEARQTIGQAHMDLLAGRVSRVGQGLRSVDRQVQEVDSDLEATQQHWEALVDRMQQAEQNSFGTIGRPITIRPD